MFEEAGGEISNTEVQILAWVGVSCSGLPDEIPTPWDRIITTVGDVGWAHIPGHDHILQKIFKNNDVVGYGVLIKHVRFDPRIRNPIYRGASPEELAQAKKALNAVLGPSSVPADIYQITF